MAFVRRAFTASAAGLVTAVIIGLGFGTLDRLLMRLVALGAGETPGFSMSGTAGILAAVIVLSLPAAIAFAATTRHAWIGYAFAIVGTIPHVVNLVGTITVYGEAPGRPTPALFALAYGLYLGSLVAMVMLTAALSRRLSRAFSSRATSSREVAGVGSA